jgi:hypothetical protein
VTPSALRAILAAFTSLVFFATFLSFLRLDDGQRKRQVGVKIAGAKSFVFRKLQLLAHVVVELTGAQK